MKKRFKVELTFECNAEDWNDPEIKEFRDAISSGELKREFNEDNERFKCTAAFLTVLKHKHSNNQDHEQRGDFIG